MSVACYCGKCINSGHPAACGLYPSSSYRTGSGLILHYAYPPPPTCDSGRPRARPCETVRDRATPCAPVRDRGVFHLRTTLRLHTPDTTLGQHVPRCRQQRRRSRCRSAGRRSAPASGSMNTEQWSGTAIGYSEWGGQGRDTRTHTHTPSVCLSAPPRARARACVCVRDRARPCEACETVPGLASCYQTGPGDRLQTDILRARPCETVRDLAPPCETVRVFHLRTTLRLHTPDTTAPVPFRRRPRTRPCEAARGLRDRARPCELLSDWPRRLPAH